MDYGKMTDDEFDEILQEILECKMTIQILSIPGVYELISEEYNNEVLDLWARRQAKKETDK